MSRKKNQDRQTPVSAPASPVLNRIAWWRYLLAPLLGVAACCYLYYFFKVPGVRQSVYGSVYSQAFIVDEMLVELVKSWIGDDVQHFGILDRAPVFAVGLWICLSALAIGWLVLPRRLRENLDWLEQVVFAAGVGLNLVSLYTLIVGLAGGLMVWGLWIVPMAAAVLGASGKLIVTGLRKKPLPSRPSTESLTAAAKTSHWWWLAVAPFAIWFPLVAAVPPFDFDVREYHLQVPKEWFLQGYIDFVPHNVYGNMPLGAEMHALTGMVLMPQEPSWWFGALAGKVVMSGYALLSAASVYAICRRFFLSRSAGYVAAAVLLSTHWVMYVSTTGLIEGALGCYLLLAIHAVLIYMRQRGMLQGLKSDEPSTPQAPSSAFVGLAGFMAGAAAACKYPALIFIVAPVGLVLLLLSGRKVLQNALVYGLLVLAACGPWYVKNAIVAGNPTYPLLYHVFGGRNWDQKTNERWHAAHQVPKEEGFRPPFLASALYRVGLASNQLSPLLVPLGLFSVLMSRNRRVILLLWGMVLFYFFAWWLLTHRQERFFAPALFLLALLAGLGFAWTEYRPWRWLVGSILAVGFFTIFIVNTSGALGIDRRVLMAFERFRHDPVRLAPPQLFLNENVKPGESVLVVGDAAVFDLEMHCYYDTCWNPSTFEAWMKDRTAKERLQTLAEHNVSYVYVNWQEIDRYRSPGNYGFTDYVTMEVVRDEMVLRQKIFERVPIPMPAISDRPMDPSQAEIFRVNYSAEEELSP